MVISEHLNAFVARREQVRKKNKGMQFVNLGMPLVCICLVKKTLRGKEDPNQNKCFRSKSPVMLTFKVYHP